MRKLFAILLLLLLPLQASWAAVAGYCQHEQGAATRHLGHHEHQHHQAPKATSHQTSSAINPAADLDCSLCQAGCLLAMLTEPGLSATTLLVADPAVSIDPPPSSAPLDLPERPNWS